MKLEELIMSIKMREIVVPEFQREFVWDKDRCKELMSSLLRGYPVGGLLIWKTNSPPKLKGNEDEVETRNYQVLLDGQQRSTAIYMLLTGNIPPYYTEEEIIRDPRTLAYNLYSREFKYWRQTEMSQDPSWVFVVDCMTDKVKEIDIASELNERFKKLSALDDFDFNFSETYDVKVHRRVFGALKILFAQAGLRLVFSTHQNWKIILPSFTIDTTINELNSLYTMPPEFQLPDGTWKKNRYEDVSVDENKFKNFWNNEIIPTIESYAEKYLNFQELVSVINQNYRDLVAIKNFEVYVQNIPHRTNFGEAIDIFDKINSQGIQLTHADLALTHITSIWPEARRQMKIALAKFKDKFFDFDLNLCTRLLVLEATGITSYTSLKSSYYKSLRSLSSQELEDHWNKVIKIINYILEFLIGEKITGASYIKSKSSLIPIYYYLSLRNGKFTDEKNKKRAIHWLVNSLMWGRYSGSTDTTLSEDINILKNNKGNVWDDLIGKIIEQRGRIKVELSDLEGQSTNSRFAPIIFLMFKNNNAIDWFNGLKIDENLNNIHNTHYHHIFPVNLLQNSGYDEDINKINDIANIAIITADTNLRISASPPNKYLPKVQTNYPEALSSQLIPNNPKLWEIENYEDFIDARRRLIRDHLNKYIESLNSEKIEKRDNWENLLSISENEKLEFKETWTFDVRKSKEQNQNVKNSKLKLSCIKTIAGFMNSDGGNLFIGVTDDNSIEGLESDLTFTNGSMDRLLVNINGDLHSAIGVDKQHYFTMEHYEIDGKYIIRVEVKKVESSKTWVNFEGNTYFYIREGNRTIALNGDEADIYWNERLNLN